MNNTSPHPIANSANKRSAQKLIDGVRRLYCSSTHLDEKVVKRKIHQLLSEFVRYAPAVKLNASFVLHELKAHFAVQPKPPGKSLATLPAPKTAANKRALAQKTNSQTAASDNSQDKSPSVIQGLGYDAKLATMLLSEEQRTLPPALQRKEMLARIERATIAAENNGIQLLDLLDHLDTVLNARNESFYQAVNQSFYTIIHHLNPRRAKKLGLPLSSEIGQPRWFDLGRIKRLIEYIQCGRMAKDAARDYSRRLKAKSKPRQ